MIAYWPAALFDVAVVLAVGSVSRSSTVSPLTKPEEEMSSAGLAAPMVRCWSLACATSGAFATESVTDFVAVA